MILPMAKEIISEVALATDVADFVIVEQVDNCKETGRRYKFPLVTHVVCDPRRCIEGLDLEYTKLKRIVWLRQYILQLFSHDTNLRRPYRVRAKSIFD